MGRTTRSRKRPSHRKPKKSAWVRPQDRGAPPAVSCFPENISGCIFLIGNTILGIPRHLKLRHPCCILYEEGARVYVIKGTALNNILPHYRDHYVIVHPDGLNGLGKPTAFEKFLRELPNRCLFGEDCLGRLSEKDLQRIREAIQENG